MKIFNSLIVVLASAILASQLSCKEVEHTPERAPIKKVFSSSLTIDAYPEPFAPYLFEHPNEENLVGMLDSCRYYWEANKANSSGLEFKHRNVISIMVNKEGEILLNGSPISMEMMGSRIFDLYFNKDNKPENPEQLLISGHRVSKALFLLNIEKGINNEVLKGLFSEINKIFRKIRSKKSKEYYKKDIDQLDHSKLTKIVYLTPLKVWVALPSGLEDLATKIRT